MHYPANVILATPTPGAMILYGCIVVGRFPLYQRTKWQSKVWQQTRWWSHSHSMARRSLCYLGRHIQLPTLSFSGPSHLGMSSACAASAAEAAATRQEETDIDWSINKIGTEFIYVLDHQIFIQYWWRTRNIVFIPTPFCCNPALQCSLLPSPIHSAMLMLKCNVTIRDTTSSWLFFIISANAREYSIPEAEGRKNSNNKIMIIIHSLWRKSISL